MPWASLNNNQSTNHIIHVMSHHEVINEVSEPTSPDNNYFSDNKNTNTNNAANNNNAYKSSPPVSNV